MAGKQQPARIVVGIGDFARKCGAEKNTKSRRNEYAAGQEGMHGSFFHDFPLHAHTLKISMQYTIEIF
jgi:hypothetical protein